MSREQKEAIAETLAKLMMNTIGWEEPLDGDATEDISKFFLKELNALCGNR